jgi:carbon monoxide dehydrogenase subunit G
MITINLRATLHSASPDQVFDALADPQGLKTLLPRMRKIEHQPTGPNSANLVMHIAIGSVFGTIPCEGVLRWTEPNEIIFTVHRPLPVETRWRLTQVGTSTELNVGLWLDLVPLLGPMAKYVPTNVVEEMIRNELKHAIRQIPVRLSEQKQDQERVLVQPRMTEAAAA